MTNLSIEIINHIFGIDYADNDKYSVSFKRTGNNLKSRGINLSEVIYSLYKHKDSVWIIAANKYYNEEDCRDLINYIIDFKLYNEYFLE